MKMLHTAEQYSVPRIDVSSTAEKVYTGSQRQALRRAWKGAVTVWKAGGMHRAEGRAIDIEIWSLTDVERIGVAQQAAAGISSLCFFNGFQVSDALGQQVAKELEAKAYDRAKVEAATTTGSRPKYEPLGSATCSVTSRMKTFRASH
jgi:hypothetical protein